MLKQLSILADNTKGILGKKNLFIKNMINVEVKFSMHLNEVIGQKVFEPRSSLNPSPLTLLCRHKIVDVSSKGVTPFMKEP